MSLLLAPVDIQAIVLDHPRSAIGADADFHKLPYYDTSLGRDVNGDVPYLAETVTAKAFHNCRFLLHKGVHLNWDLPPFLKSTIYNSKDPMDFPAVPNRWLVVRYRNGKAERDWVIESDAVLENLEKAPFIRMAQTSIDIDIHSGIRPYTYMGRTQSLAEWKAGSDNREGWTTWKTVHMDKPLTSMGWGTPAFDTFYPNCTGVFGLHDPDITSQNLSEVSYKVIGWYEGGTDDYWSYFLTETGTMAEVASTYPEHMTQEEVSDHFYGAMKNLMHKKLRIESEAPGNELQSAERMACVGACIPATLPTDAAAGISSPVMAVGNTPTEALSAMIAGETSGLALGPERQKLEDQLEAVLLSDQLKAQKIDIGPKFREMRHAGEFAANKGGTLWHVRNIDDNPTKETDGQSHQKTRMPQLPESVAPLLEKLNQAQEVYDKAVFELNSLRTELYADWYRYMHCAYPPTGETTEFVDVTLVREMMREGSLKRYIEVKEQLGAELDPEDMRLDPANFDVDDIDSLSDAVRYAHTVLSEHLSKEVNADIPKQLQSHWELQYKPGPRFWEPAPPTIVMAVPKGSFHSPVVGGNTICTVFKGNFDLGRTDFNATGLLAAIELPTESTGNKIPPIFRAEWEAEVFPVSTMHSATRKNGVYDPAFIEKNFHLGENEPDQEANVELDSLPSLTRTASIYTGSTYTNLKLGPRYKRLLSEYHDHAAANKDDTPLTREEKAFAANIEKAEKFLEDHQVFSITLNGFNSALLQMHESLQLNPADPLGFKDFQDFAEEVATALHGGKGFSPDPSADFMPIRSGGMQIVAVRLIDIFGGYHDLKPGNFHTSVPMSLPRHARWVRLQPRLSQASRFNFKFLKAADPAAQDSHSHPNSNPVCGWMVPNLLDGSLVFYNADGKRLGDIDQNGAWITTGVDDSLQPGPWVMKVRDWILTKDSNGDFVGALIEDLEESMDNIHPMDREGQSAFSVLMGRPMAIARLGVSLELKGRPARNVSWTELRADQNRHTVSTDDFEKVRFTYRLGEYHQRNDGLIGYWQIEDGDLDTDFCVNDSISASLKLPDQYKSILTSSFPSWNTDWKLGAENQTLAEFLEEHRDRPLRKQDFIRQYVRNGSGIWDTLVRLDWLRPEKKITGIKHYAEAGRLSIPATNSQQEFIALLDPHGKIHLSSGIQPVKSIQLPELFIKEALQQLEIRILVAPVLGSQQEMTISVPKEQNYEWTWEEQNSWLETGADEDSQQGTSVAEAKLKHFNPSAHFVHRNVLREGRLVIRHRELETEDNGSETGTTPDIDPKLPVENSHD